MIGLINEIAEIWFRYMASATLQATLLALFILCIILIGRRWPPALRHALMMLALCKFVIPPMLSLPTGLFNRIKPLQQLDSAHAVPIPHSRPERFSALIAPIPVLMDLNRATEQPKVVRVLAAFTAKGYLLLLHFLGALLICAFAAVQKLRLRRLASLSDPVQDPGLAEAFDELCKSMKMSRRPLLLISRDNHAPITFGAWKPAVLLPHAFIGTLSLPDIRVILGHELAHHRRLDPWFAWLQVAVSAVWWFNPVYWLLSRNIRSTREDCCDDMVLASGLASREVYCRTLLRAARATLGSSMSRAAFAYISESSQPLRRRFTRIMGAKFIRAPKLAITGMVAVFALGLFLLPGIEPRVFPEKTALAEERVDARTYLVPRAAAAASPPRTKPIQKSALSDYYRKWLEEDVIYIITPKEKSSFKELRTDRERDSFIEQFWASRDSSFKAEHYRRLAYANEHFASSKPGWRTDRGRVFIMFGKPDRLESYPIGGYYAETAIEHPFEKWLYRHIDGVGDDIEIEFVDTTGGNEFRIAMDPKEKDSLLAPAIGSLTYDVRTDYTPLSADRTLVRLVVEFNNKDLEFKKQNELNRAVVDISGIVTNLAGRTIAEFEDVISVEYSDQNFEEGKGKRPEYQKVVAVQPGQQYKLILVLTDTNSKKIGSRSLNLIVPNSGQEPTH
jgi:GWxTD domain-containing protein